MPQILAMQKAEIFLSKDSTVLASLFESLGVAVQYGEDLEQSTLMVKETLFGKMFWHQTKYSRFEPAEKDSMIVYRYLSEEELHSFCNAENVYILINSFLNREYVSSIISKRTKKTGGYC